MKKILQKSLISIQRLIYTFFIHLLLGFDKIVQRLIENGANVNTVDEGTDSALLFATANGNIFQIYS